MLNPGKDRGPVETTPLVSGRRGSSSTDICYTFVSKQSRTKERVLQPFSALGGIIPSETPRASSVENEVDNFRVKELCRAHSSEPSGAASSPTTALQCESRHWQALLDATQQCPPSVPSSLLSRLNSFISSGVSLRLENSGSVARDHLASERTFLAYVRTSLAIASSGVALVQLFTVASTPSPHHLSPTSRRLHIYIRPLGATTIAIGLLVLIIGVTRYFTVQAALKRGYFPAARLVTGVIALASGTLVALTFTILVAGRLDPKGRL